MTGASTRFAYSVFGVAAAVNVGAAHNVLAVCRMVGAGAGVPVWAVEPVAVAITAHAVPATNFLQVFTMCSLGCCPGCDQQDI
jgi:hypothetical protein